ncbi:MAG: hypothetical protein RLY43_564 [Bacteroidota bacterium]|jgi:hypothetical protein
MEVNFNALEKFVNTYKASLNTYIDHTFSDFVQHKDIKRFKDEMIKCGGKADLMLDFIDAYFSIIHANKGGKGMAINFDHIARLIETNQEAESITIAGCIADFKQHKNAKQFKKDILQIKFLASTNLERIIENYRHSYYCLKNEQKDER